MLGAPSPKLLIVDNWSCKLLEISAITFFFSDVAVGTSRTPEGAGVPSHPAVAGAYSRLAHQASLSLLVHSFSAASWAHVFDASVSLVHKTRVSPSPSCAYLWRPELYSLEARPSASEATSPCYIRAYLCVPTVVVPTPPTRPVVRGGVASRVSCEFAVSCRVSVGGGVSA